MASSSSAGTPAAGAVPPQHVETGAPGLRPWRPALFRLPRTLTIYDRLELLLFALVLGLSFGTPPRTADGQPNAPLMATLQGSTGGGLCIPKRLTGVPCGGCGLTRGFVQLAHGDPVEAMHLNPLTPVVFAWVVWHTLATLARNLGWQLRHGIPPRWVWRFYVSCWFGFAGLALARWVLGTERI